MCSVMLNEENLFSTLFLFTQLLKMTNGTFTYTSEETFELKWTSSSAVKAG